MEYSRIGKKRKNQFHLSRCETNRVLVPSFSQLALEYLPDWSSHHNYRSPKGLFSRKFKVQRRHVQRKLHRLDYDQKLTSRKRGWYITWTLPSVRSVHWKEDLTSGKSSTQAGPFNTFREKMGNSSRSCSVCPQRRNMVDIQRRFQHGIVQPKIKGMDQSVSSV